MPAGTTSGSVQTSAGIEGASAHQQLQYVQFGCGLCAPATWVNFDAGPAFWMEKNLPFLKPMLLKRGFPHYPKNIRYGDVIKGLPVTPGAPIHMAPGGYHIMLTGLKQKLKQGDRVPLTLIFEHAGPMTVQAVVAGPGASEPPPSK